MAVLAMASGAALVAFAALQAATVPGWLSGAGMAMVPGGLFLVALAATLVIPEHRVRARVFAYAVGITALALTFDWIAFAPGAREFFATTSAGSVHAAAMLGERAGRILFGIAGVYLDVLAVVIWLRALRGPPQTAESAESAESAGRRG